MTPTPDHPPTAPRDLSTPNLVMGYGGEARAAGQVIFTYNIVFNFRGPDRLQNHAFCTVKMDMPIDYGSDLQTLREFLSADLNIKDMVVVSWHLLADVHRPDGVRPAIQLTR